MKQRGLHSALTMDDTDLPKRHTKKLQADTNEYRS